MTCGNKDKFYSLKPKSTSDCPKSIEELERWLSKRDQNFSGKLYVAKTIQWKGHEFVQGGCSPCYLEKRWSLACCKHSMRLAKEFRRQVEDSLNKPNKAYFIFTLASKEGFRPPKGRGQALASVAKVTQTFDNMKLYAKFLRDQSQAIKLSRLTRQRVGNNYKGWRFGDCHADDKGELGPPHKDHEHSEENDWDKDINRNGLILFSDDFLIWKEPEIVYYKTIDRTSGLKFGIDISWENFRERLVAMNSDV